MDTDDILTEYRDGQLTYSIAAISKLTFYPSFFYGYVTLKIGK
jgi:hypothetical protein